MAANEQQVNVLNRTNTGTKPNKLQPQIYTVDWPDVQSIVWSWDYPETRQKRNSSYKRIHKWRSLTCLYMSGGVLSSGVWHHSYGYKTLLIEYVYTWCKCTNKLPIIMCVQLVTCYVFGIASNVCFTCKHRHHAVVCLAWLCQK